MKVNEVNDMSIISEDDDPAIAAVLAIVTIILSVCFLIASIWK